MIVEDDVADVGEFDDGFAIFAGAVAEAICTDDDAGMEDDVAADDAAFADDDVGVDESVVA